MKTFWIRYKSVICTTIVLIIPLLIFFMVDYLVNINDRFEVTYTNYIFIVLITLVLAIIAYFKSTAALKQSKTNYLLRIDERWSSREIIRAREIIHRINLKAKYPNKQEEEHNNESIKAKMAIDIVELNKKNTPEDIKDFISLLNFIDFLETIGYMYKTQAITLEEIKELLGNSIVYFYDIFRAYIEYRRRDKDQMFYCQFENLYLDIKKYNKKPC